MTHRFPIKEIAAQAGLGTATVDRVLNGRAHVSHQTRARVSAAIEELEGQEQQLAARGRRFHFDFVVEAPNRFAREIKRAAEAVLPRFAPLNLRARFQGREVMSGAEVSASLQRIAKRGSNGVCLKARDVDEVHHQISALTRKGIPVVTLATDVPDSTRIAYAGLDNAQAGRTAAELIKREVSTGVVLATVSNRAFEGEEARWSAFRASLNEGFECILVRDAAGRNVDTARAVAAAIAGIDRVDAVYSMSGANHAILAALDGLRRGPKLFIAHDLDSDNVPLLQSRRISHVLHHDLEADIAQAFRHLCAFHRAIPNPGPLTMSDVQIVMPSNVPRRFTN